MIEKIANFWLVLVTALVCITAVIIVALCLGYDGVMLNTYLTLVGAIAGGGGVYGTMRYTQKRNGQSPPQ